ncbi:MAG: CCA tRNA nucleotidyltransferase [Nitrososphaeria archaeon]
MTAELINSIIHPVLMKIKPDENDKQRFYRVYEFARKELEACLNRYLGNYFVEVSLQGSVAKDTFLKSQSDIDVFILFNPNKNITIEWFESLLIPKIIDCFKNHEYTLNYATHPYISLYIDNIEVNIVPAFKVKAPNKIISAVDRTPFHTEYVKTHLSEAQKDEVRVLKQFLKAWKLYGAEIEVQGFSGYLTELLIIAYNSFYDLLRNAVEWRAYKTCIDIEHNYSSTKKCLEKFKGSALVVVDPVDPKRNAAAALSLKNFSIFKLLSKIFLERPSVKFFFDEYEEETNPLKHIPYISNRLKKYDSYIYVLIFNVIKPIPDMIWGQMLRLKNSILNALRSQINDREIYADVWVNRTSLSKAILVIEIMQFSKNYKLHEGPYAFDVISAVNFLTKNIEAEIGPWINDDGRLYVIKNFESETITKLIIDIIKSTSLAGMVFEKVTTITPNTDLRLLNQERFNSDFMLWFRHFLERKPLKKLYDILSGNIIE